jgi:hypothetical protein
MLLLSDGTVMVQSAASMFENAWDRLTPSPSPSGGDYLSGSWSSMAPMSLQREYYGSDVLPNGNVFVLGGEFSAPPGQMTQGNETNTGELYNPVTNAWTSILSFPQSQFGDGLTETLPNGQILAGFYAGPQTYIYDPATNSWGSEADKRYGDRGAEETWVKLPDGSILTNDLTTSVGAGQRYIPSQSQWVAAGTSPVQLGDNGGAPIGLETGPAFLLPDGRAFFLGATGHTAFYTPSPTFPR